MICKFIFRIFRSSRLIHSQAPFGILTAEPDWETNPGFLICPARFNNEVFLGWYAPPISRGVRP